MRKILCALLAIAVGAWTAAARPDDYPAKPIRFIVPNPAGGGADTTARQIGTRLAERLKQPVVIDNRPGAGGTIGLTALAKSEADGYTIGMGVTATLAINPAINSKLAYDPERDFAPITLFTAAPLLLVVNPNLGVQTVADLVKLAKSRASPLAFSSPGNGTPPHLSAELFRTMVGARAVHVPYKGAPAALTGVIAGDVAFMFGNLLPTLPHVTSGRLKALGVTSLKRSEPLPAIPTIDEGGVTGYESGEWYGVVAPAGTPKEIVTRLNAEIVRIAHLPELREQFRREGTEAVGSTPEQFARFIAGERQKWSKVARDSGARID